jgi:hypothetical protein
MREVGGSTGKQGEVRGIPRKNSPFSLSFPVFRFFPSKFWSPRAWRIWVTWVHWRLETYGVFHPAGTFNKTAFQKLLKQLPGYLHWVSEMDAIRKKSPTPR